MESTDLRQQKEIADLNDQYKEFLKNYEAFREMITRELKEEFTKINENFEAQARIIAQKEARLRAEIEALKRAHVQLALTLSNTAACYFA